MYNYDNRILLHVKLFPENSKTISREMISLYLKLNNALTGMEVLPNINKICNYCKKNNNPLGAYIRHTCDGLKLDSNVYNSYKTDNINDILNVLDPPDKGKLRIVLYTGYEPEIENLKLSEATHNMIVKFSPDSTEFVSTQVHKNFPNFYQNCYDSSQALLYIEALLVDACMCHYFGVSDAALHHDDKQRISSEKIDFLKDFLENGDHEIFTEETIKIIKYVVKNLNDNAPYISLLSIFTIAAKYVEDITDSDNYIETHFNEYCTLWELFQKWYYKKYGKLFTIDDNIIAPTSTIFYRNKYQGQISDEEASKEMLTKRKEYQKKKENFIFDLGMRNRFAFVILKNVPPENSMDITETLFEGKIHQSKWGIFHWTELKKFEHIKEFIEVIPFMLEF